MIATRGLRRATDSDTILPMSYIEKMWGEYVCIDNQRLVGSEADYRCPAISLAPDNVSVQSRQKSTQRTPMLSSRWHASKLRIVHLLLYLDCASSGLGHLSHSLPGISILSCMDGSCRPTRSNCGPCVIWREERPSSSNRPSLLFVINIADKIGPKATMKPRVAEPSKSMHLSP